MAVTARGRAYARLIRAGRMTLADVPTEPAELVGDVKESYKALYNEELTE